MSQVSTKEPLFHIVKREGVTFVRASLIRLVAILLALVVCAFVIMGMTGMNPLSVYAGIWSCAVRAICSEANSMDIWRLSAMIFTVSCSTNQ